MWNIIGVIILVGSGIWFTLKDLRKDTPYTGASRA
jgi:hypothetical protein